MYRDSLIRVILFAVTCACISSVQAHLKPLSDEALSNVTGQAMAAVDVVQTSSEDFTRVTLGMTTSVQANVNQVTLGNAALTSNVDITNLSLGHISTDATKVQLDGNTYAVGDIVPFEGIDPYVEVAQSTDGTDSIDGFRIGFNQARGTLSGTINSLSGNIGMKVTDSSGNTVDAQLLNSAGTATNSNAQYIGIAGTGTDCANSVNCAPLSNLQTLDIGSANAGGTVGYTNDFFISFQKSTLTWQDPASGKSITAGPGLYFNIPTSMTLDMAKLITGIPRARTEYIDRGVGMF